MYDPFCKVWLYIFREVGVVYKYNLSDTLKIEGNSLRFYKSFLFGLFSTGMEGPINSLRWAPP